MENCNIRLSNLRRSEHEKPDCEVLALGDEVVAERPRSTLPALLEDYAKHGLKKAFGSFSEYKLGKGFKVVLVDYKEVAIVPTWGHETLREAIFAAQTECHASDLNCSLYVVGDKYAEEMPKDEAVALVEQFRDGWQVGMEAFSRGTYKTAVRIWGRLAESGNRKAAFRLAEMFDFAEGVKKNDREAAKYYLMAAEANHPVAQQRVASRYKDGRGLTKSLTQSLKWYFVLQSNDEASTTQRKAARGEINRFNSVYVVDGFPGARDILRRAEASANTWRNSRKKQLKP